jgi:hypothetical protein
MLKTRLVLAGRQYSNETTISEMPAFTPYSVTATVCSLLVYNFEGAALAKLLPTSNKIAARVEINLDFIA